MKSDPRRQDRKASEFPLGFGDFCATVTTRAASGRARDEAELLTNVAVSLINLAMFCGAPVVGPHSGQAELAPWGEHLVRNSYISLSSGGKWRAGGMSRLFGYEIGSGFEEYWAREGWDGVAKSVFSARPGVFGSVYFDALYQWALARQQEVLPAQIVLAWNVLETLFGWIDHSEHSYQAVEEASAVILRTTREEVSFLNLFRRFRRFRNASVHGIALDVGAREANRFNFYLSLLLSNLANVKLLKMDVEQFSHALKQPELGILPNLRKIERWD